MYGNNKNILCVTECFVNVLSYVRSFSSTVPTFAAHMWNFV